MALRLAASRYDGLLDVLLEAEAVDGPAAFPPRFLDSLRRALGCDAAHYREWTADGLSEFALAADQPSEWLAVWEAYPHVRGDDPLPGGQSSPFTFSVPPAEWLGQPLTISDFLSARAFRQTGLYLEVCKPLGVREVLKLFVPTGEQAPPASSLTAPSAGSRTPIGKCCAVCSLTSSNCDETPGSDRRRPHRRRSLTGRLLDFTR
jgi:hypothetical protein